MTDISKWLQQLDDDLLYDSEYIGVDIGDVHPLDMYFGDVETNFEIEE